MNIKKKIDGLLFRTSQIWVKIGRTFKFDLLKKNFLFIIVFLYFAIYFGGIVNTILESGKLPSTVIFSPYKDYQTWTEFTIAFFNFIFGSFGVYLLYRGANNFNKRTARLYFISGVILLILSTIIGTWFLYEKYLI
ncbi:MAG: hypothetical protein QXJ17_03765 [Nitrososphaeria archaeon]